LQLKRDSNHRVLDVGAGNGAFMALALDCSPQLQIFGAEYSQSAIDQAPPAVRARLSRCNLQDHAAVLPWGGNFQLLTCMEVLEHLPDDLLAIRQMAQALVPGGHLFVSVPGWPAQWGPQDDIAGHVRRYEPQIIQERLQQAGFEIVHMKCWGGIICRLYLTLTDLIGPGKTMAIRPTGIAGLAAATIYQMMKLDDLLSFGRGPQLLVLARKVSG
jgi:2-polyprenyl-3-methyl-5-hydroxy-6-metoxy-1,4-benzoquinol methylase